MKGADAVICTIGSGGINPKGPKTVDYGVRFLALHAACCHQCNTGCQTRSEAPGLWTAGYGLSLTTLLLVKGTTTHQDIPHAESHRDPKV